MWLLAHTSLHKPAAVFQGSDMADPEVFPFLQLPCELREAIYKIVIAQSIEPHERPRKKGYAIWPGTPISPTNLALDKSSGTKVRMRHFRLASKLMYSNWQIYREFSALIRKRIRHLRLAGDFQKGIRSTQKLFDCINTRPWLFHSILTIRVKLTLLCYHKHQGSFWYNPDSWAEYPQIMVEVHKAFRSIRRSYNPVGYGHRQRSRSVIPHRPDLLPSRRTKISNLDAKPPFAQHNTLSDLARIIESFPLLNRLEIEPDPQNLLMLWPNPMDTMKYFEAFHAKGVEVILLLKQMQRWIFFAIMQHIGIDTAKSTIWCEDGSVMPSSDLFEQKTEYVVGWCRFFDQFPASGGSLDEVTPA